MTIQDAKGLLFRKWQLSNPQSLHSQFALLCYFRTPLNVLVLVQEQDSDVLSSWFSNYVITCNWTKKVASGKVNKDLSSLITKYGGDVTNHEDCVARIRSGSTVVRFLSCECFERNASYRALIEVSFRLFVNFSKRNANYNITCNWISELPFFLTELNRRLYYSFYYR